MEQWAFAGRSAPRTKTFIPASIFDRAKQPQISKARRASFPNSSKPLNFIPHCHCHRSPALSRFLCFDKGFDAKCQPRSFPRASQSIYRCFLPFPRFHSANRKLSPALVKWPNGRDRTVELLCCLLLFVRSFFSFFLVFFFFFSLTLSSV